MKQEAINRGLDCILGHNSPSAAKGLFILLHNTLQLFCSLPFDVEALCLPRWQSHAPFGALGEEGRGASRAQHHKLHPDCIHRALAARREPPSAHVIPLRAQIFANHPSHCITWQSAAPAAYLFCSQHGVPSPAGGEKTGYKQQEEFFLTLAVFSSPLTLGSFTLEVPPIALFVRVDKTRMPSGTFKHTALRSQQRERARLWSAGGASLCGMLLETAPNPCQ